MARTLIAMVLLFLPGAFGERARQELSGSDRSPKPETPKSAHVPPTPRMPMPTGSTPKTSRFGWNWSPGRMKPSSNGTQPSAFSWSMNRISQYVSGIRIPNRVGTNSRSSFSISGQGRRTSPSGEPSTIPNTGRRRVIGGSRTQASSKSRPNEPTKRVLRLSEFAWGKLAWEGLPSPNTDDRFQVRLRFESKPTDEFTAVRRLDWDTDE